MYYIYKEQAYLAAFIKAANRLSQSNTIPDKTTWESFPHHVHFPTQQNYFQNNAFGDRYPLPPIQYCFPQTPRDRAFFWIHNNIAFRGRGRGKNRYSYDVATTNRAEANTIGNIRRYGGIPFRTESEKTTEERHN